MSSQKLANISDDLEINTSADIQKNLVLNQSPTNYIPSKEEPYMSENQLEYFKEKLKSMEIDMSNRIRNKAITLFFTSKTATSDYIDKSMTDAIEFTEVLTMTNLQEQLLVVKECIRLIDYNLTYPNDMSKGRYGYCVQTDEPIGLDRLKIKPDTLFSAQAKAQIEKKRNN